MSAAIGSAAAIAQQGQPNQVGNAYANLSSGEFLQIILSELSNQDPLAPNDTTAILEQLSSLRNIESQVSLESQLEALVTQNAISSSAGLIGKFVEGLDANNRTVSGTVLSLAVEEGKPILKLADGTSLPADRVTQVHDAPASGARALGGIDPNALLGTRVAGVGTDGTAMSGVVSGIRFVRGEGFLELEAGQVMPFTGLERIGSAGSESATPRSAPSPLDFFNPFNQR